MADRPSTRTAQDWASSHSRLTDLYRYLDQAPLNERDAIEREIAELQDELLETPAPSLIGVVSKLFILWEGKLDGLDQSSQERRLVVEDLKGLIQAQRELIGS